MTIFYDNYYDSKVFNETKQELFDRYAEEENWAVIENVPDERVFEEMSEQDDIAWQDFQYELKKAMEGKHFILTGTCGRWDGRKSGGTFVNSISELLRHFEHLEYIKFYDLEGHFFIEGSHHDGDDLYELKRLTDKGYKYADKCNFARDRQLHDKLCNCHFFTALPRFGKLIYGV